MGWQAGTLGVLEETTGRGEIMRKHEVIKTSEEFGFLKRK